MVTATGGADDRRTIRPGTANDVVACTRVWRATVDPSLPDVVTGYPLYQHEADTGTLLVAEIEGVVAGFAGSVTRDERWFLADLFVDPDHHGIGLGRDLLNVLVATDEPGAIRATMASDDPRALTLYTQLGMSPRWPCFSLIGLPSRTRPPAIDVITPAEHCSADELIDRAERCGCPLSPIDLDYWQRTVGTEFVLVGETGGAVIRWSTPFSIEHPDAISIGPVFSMAAEHLPTVVAAVLADVRSRDDRHPTKLYVPGPSSALRPLLDAGHRIEAFDLFSSSIDQLLDPRRVLPSHDLL